jgi:hypothetical protein
MRLTILTGLLSLTSAACLQPVGGGDCVGERCDMPDGGMPVAKCADDAQVTELSTNTVIRTLADFDKLPKGCWALNANLRLEGQAITSLAKLGDLIEVNDLELVDTGLTTIDSKQPFSVFGSLLVSGNTKLTSLSNLAVKKWEGPTTGGTFSVNYTVRNNALLASVDALKYIQKVDVDLRFTDNPKLTAITLDELTTVTGAVVITNTGAPSIGFSQLTKVGRVEISGNTALTTVRGFGATSIGGDFILRGNSKLSQLGAMSSLTTISGALVVDDNDALVDLAGLTGTMQRISGAVTITGNASLTGLGSLSHATSIGAGSITNNPALTNCKAIEVDHCVPNSTVSISGNAGSSTNCPCWCGQ